MLEAMPSRKPYPSDLTNEQWKILEPLVPLARTNRGGQPRDVNLRDIINLNYSWHIKQPPKVIGQRISRVIVAECGWLS